MSQVKKSVLIFTYFSYYDALIQAYTLPYVRLIRKHLEKDSAVVLVCLEKEEKPLLNEAQILKQEGVELINFKYKGSGLKASVAWFGYFRELIKVVKRRDIEIIHAWCTPAGAFAYLLASVTKTKLIIDSYEPHAEAMVENGTWKKGSLLFKILFTLEKLQTNKARVFISATSGMLDYAEEKYRLNLSNKKFYLKPACVNLDLFSNRNLKNKSLIAQMGFKDKIVCVYAGKFGGIYQEKQVFNFLKVAHVFWGDEFRVLLLTGHKHEQIKKWCREINLDFDIFSITKVQHNLIPNYIGLGDFGITPVKPVPTKRYCTPIKNGEYWALGLPVVIPANISDDSDIIKKYDIGAVLERLTEDDYLQAVQKIDSMLKNNSREELYVKIRKVAEKYRNFDVADKIYKEIYTSEG